LILKFSDLIQEAVDKKVHMDDILSMKSRENIARMKTISNKLFNKKILEIEKELEREINVLIKGGEQE